MIFSVTALWLFTVNRVWSGYRTASRLNTLKNPALFNEWTLNDHTAVISNPSLLHAWITNDNSPEVSQFLSSEFSWGYDNLGCRENHLVMLLYTSLREEGTPTSSWLLLLGSFIILHSIIPTWCSPNRVDFSQPGYWVIETLIAWVCMLLLIKRYYKPSKKLTRRNRRSLQNFSVGSHWWDIPAPDLLLSSTNLNSTTHQIHPDLELKENDNHWT